MISRPVAVGLLAAGCLTAAAGGSYLAVRENAASRTYAQQPSLPPAASDPSASGAVTETEAIVTPEPAPAAAAPAAARPRPPRQRPEPAPAPRRVERQPTTREASAPLVPVEPRAAEAPAASPVLPEAAMAPTPAAADAPSQDPVPAPPIERVYDEIVVTAASVIGLEIERTITSEQAELEDRVDARVTRDVYAGGRLAIPAGSRVTGSVTLVERGGKMKNRARLGVRFHTLVLANGLQVPLRTEAIYREGDSPGAESSRKIGGAAIGGAVLGAILGGGKGAATGAAVGAAGGTAAVMAGGRNAATLTSGSVVTARLTAPLVIELER